MSDGRDPWVEAWIDGLTPEQMRDELRDYMTIIAEVSKVYDEATGGRISKPNTMAFAVIGEIERHYAEVFGS